jgi:hypothetical protein
MLLLIIILSCIHRHLRNVDGEDDNVFSVVKEEYTSNAAVITTSNILPFPNWFYDFIICYYDDWFLITAESWMLYCTQQLFLFICKIMIKIRLKNTSLQYERKKRERRDEMLLMTVMWRRRARPQPPPSQHHHDIIGVWYRSIQALRRTRTCGDVCGEPARGRSRTKMQAATFGELRENSEGDGFGDKNSVVGNHESIIIFTVNHDWLL